MRSLYFLNENGQDYKQLTTIKSNSGRKIPIEIAITYEPFSEGVNLLICYGHDTDLFEDDNTIKIPLTTLLDAGCEWAKHDFCENHKYNTHQAMAHYLRMMAEMYDLKAKDYSE